MFHNIQKLFTDQKLVKRIKTRLPKLFQLAELESTRTGKVGMQIVNQYHRPVLNRSEKDTSAYSETIFHLKEK